MKKNSKKTAVATTKHDRSKLAAKPTRASSPMEKPFTKSHLISALAEKTAISKQKVAEVFTHLQEVIAAHFQKTAPKQFVLPGLVKITVKHKPACNVVRLRPLKALKDLV